MGRKVTLLDGGFSTQLQSHVNEPIDGTPLWTASFLYTHPQAVVDTHLDFLRAGSDIISTNTYQANIDGFMKYLGLNHEESIQLFRTAVSLAKSACKIYKEESTEKREIRIAGSIGPYGGSLNDGSEYTGDYVNKITKEELIRWHRPRIETLFSEGIDLFAFETMPALAEVEALLEILKDFPNAKAWISFSCKDSEHTSHGEKFQDAIQSCISKNKSQIFAVSANCVNPLFVSSLFKSLKENTGGIPLMVYPNSGEIYDAQSGWSGSASHSVESFIPEWLDLGIQFIGGCCRISAEDISKIAHIISESGKA